MKIFERIHRRRVGRKTWFSKIEIDVAEKNGIPFFYVKMKDYKNPDREAVIRLSVAEALRLAVSILDNISRYPIIIGDAGAAKQKKNSRRENSSSADTDSEAVIEEM